MYGGHKSYTKKSGYRDHEHLCLKESMYGGHKSYIKKSGYRDHEHLCLKESRYGGPKSYTKKSGYRDHEIDRLINLFIISKEINGYQRKHKCAYQAVNQSHLCLKESRYVVIIKVIPRNLGMVIMLVLCLAVWVCSRKVCSNCYPCQVDETQTLQTSW